MGQKFKKPHHNKSVISDFFKKQSSVTVSEDIECFTLSFKHFDRKQSSTLIQWESDGMLAQAIETLASYCHKPLIGQQSKKFIIYGNFPKESEFTHPSYIPPDAKWARIHVNGSHVIAGHIVRNTFYVVFLDHNHKFYITVGANN